MHILISAVSSAEHPTGICRHAASVARCLATREEVSGVTLLTRTEQARYFHSAFQLRDPKLTVVPIDLGPGALARNRWYMCRLPETVALCGPDIVHLSFPVPFVRSRFACPVVTSLHDLYPFDIPGNSGLSKMVFQRLIVRHCLRNSDAVVCGSGFTFDRLSVVDSNATRQKAVRIYQCVEPSRATARAPSPPFSSGPFLLCVAQHRSNKNLQLLLRAFATLPPKATGTRSLSLVIVGADGPETSSLRNTVHRLGLEQRIAFVSSISDPELSWLYRSCELFVAPSSIEGFGLPVIEALQHRARVVCSDIPVFREIADDACHYFDLHAPDPVHALAKAISLARNGPPRQVHGLDRFSVDQVSAQYVAVYSRLIAQGSAALPLPEPIPDEQVLDYDQLAG